MDENHHNPSFAKKIQAGYSPEGASIQLGAAVLDDQIYPAAPIQIPLSTLNRHGLITGATGTGKTKSIQLLAEQLSNQGVPVLMMDLKGDLSGLAAEGEENKKILERQSQIGKPYKPKGYPVEFLTLKKAPGLKCRATLTEFGPILLSQLLGLNDTQSGILSVVFQYCDDESIPLIDLKDLKKTLNFIKKHASEEVAEEYGTFNKASASAIVRKIVELEQQGAKQFFGEPSFEVADLVRKNPQGKGFISILRLHDLQDKPKLFSCFMLGLLAEVYAAFEEIGDPEKPKLVIFIDEAHLVFKKASKALLEHLEMVVKLIRSKGVGVIFSTQVPSDIPSEILSQLSLKIQHALRASTAKDRKAIKLIAENFPISSFYDTKNLLTELKIGHALVTGLNEKGGPLPLVEVMCSAPQSRMGPLKLQEVKSIIENSNIVDKYEEALDRESAYEILQDKIETSKKETQKAKSSKKTSRSRRVSVTETVTKQIGRTLARELTRSLLGVLGIKKRRRR